MSKTDKSDPKRLRKDLPKLVKNIAPEDQMMLIGGSLKFKAELPRDVVSNLISYALRNCAEVVPDARN